MITLKENIDQIRRKYFNAHQKIHVLKGEILLRAGHLNTRLYLVEEGTFVGYLKEGKQRIEVFRSSRDMFLGVYSFFSPDSISYSTVEAETDCTLLYLETFDQSDQEFAIHFLPVLVHELKLRQELAHCINQEREEMMQHLFSQEKLSTLGQLAAGLAHELNNAVAMISRKTEYLTDWVNQYLVKTEEHLSYTYFRKGLDADLSFSTREMRSMRKQLEESGISTEDAELLASLGDKEGTLKSYSPDKLKYFFQLVEVGQCLHDIGIAAAHAAHVVTSVKELGVKRRMEPTEIDINQTIRQSLLLVNAALGKIRIEEEYDKLPFIWASPGDLVQVWLNIIKNAAESLIQSGTISPSIHIRTKHSQEYIRVEIEDNGPGIAEEVKPHLFQPNVTTKVQGLTFGLGLGLSIVQKIIEAYDGKITVESVPGCTLFTIVIPINHGKIIHH